MWNITLRILIKSLRFKTPQIRKNIFNGSVYLSVVCLASVDTITLDRTIRLD